jgi:hypothetical protein
MKLDLNRLASGGAPDTLPPGRDDVDAIADEAVPARYGRKAVLGMAVFGTIWCAITGVFVGFVAYSLARSLDAAARYASTEGVVTAGRLSTHSGDDGPTYGLDIRYTYAARGREYAGDRYDFAGWSSSDYAYWRGVADAHPKGAPVTVYYDPDDPAESVLHMGMPGLMLFLIVFLQPFIMVGAGVWVGVGAMIVRGRRVRRFMAARFQPPIDIPGWGTLRVEAGRMEIASRRSPLAVLMALAMTYGLTCFIAIFVLAFLFGGPEEASGRTVAAVLITAAGAGVAAAIATAAKGGRAVVRLDPPTGWLGVTSPVRQTEVRLTDVDRWALRTVPNPSRTRSENTPSQVPLLVAVTRGGEEVPVHVFASGDRAVAGRAARGLAELTGRPFGPPQGGRPKGAAEGDRYRDLA